MLSAVHGMAPTDVKRYSLRRQSVLRLGTSDATEGARFRPLPTSRKPPSSSAPRRVSSPRRCRGDSPPLPGRRSPALVASLVQPRTPCMCSSRVMRRGTAVIRPPPGGSHEARRWRAAVLESSAKRIVYAPPRARSTPPRKPPYEVTSRSRSKAGEEGKKEDAARFPAAVAASGAERRDTRPAGACARVPVLPAAPARSP
jgi:hypothetical protein